MIDRRQHAIVVPLERRKRGRPPLVDGDPSTVLALKIEGSLYDRVYRLASARRMTLQEFVRDALRSAAI